MPNFIILPAADVSSGKITTLANAQVRPDFVVPIAGGTYKVFAATGLSAVFTPTGTTLTQGPGVINGGSADQFLIVPETNVNNGTTITNLSGAIVSTSLNLTGLVSGRQYRVTALTIASPDVVVLSKPSGFTAGMWAVTDAARGGILRYDFTSVPYNGGSPLTNIYIYLNGSTTPIQTGLTGPGIFEVTGLTNGQSYASTVKAVNALGPSDVTSDTKTRTPTNTVIVVPPGTQRADFGTLTLARAGRFRPLDANGAPLTVTAISPTSGGAVLEKGGLAFDAIGGGTQGATYALTTSAGVINVTVNKLADTYFVSDEAELRAAISANGNAGGRTIQMREGQITLASGAGDLFLNRSYAAPGLTFKGSSCNHLQYKWGSRIFGRFKINNVANLTCRDFEIYDTGGLGRGASGLIKMENVCEEVNFIRLYGHAYVWGYFDDMRGTSQFGGAIGENPNFITSGSGVTWCGTIEENYARDVYDFVYIACPGTLSLKPCRFIANHWEFIGRDGIKIAGADDPLRFAPIEIAYNVAANGYQSGGSNGIGGDRSGVHNDMMHQFQGVSSTNALRPGYRSYMNIGLSGSLVGQTGHQGQFSSSDGKSQMTWTNPYSVGNMMALGGNHSFTLACSGGTLAFNTYVMPSTAYSDNQAGFRFGSLSPAPTTFRNIVEFTNGTLTPGGGDLLLGVNGSIIPHLQVFGSANLTGAPNTIDEAKQRYTPIDKSRGAFSNIGIYGTPRDKASWALNEAYVESWRP